jgi:hypothetical protein
MMVNPYLLFEKCEKNRLIEKKKSPLLRSGLFTTGKRFVILHLPACSVFFLVLDLGLGLIPCKDLGANRKGRKCDYHYQYHFFDFHLDFLLVIGAKCIRLICKIGKILQGLGQK